MEKPVLKSRKEWIETLEEPHRTQMLNNTSKVKLEQKIRSLEQTLLSSFVWAEKPEKHKYWEDFYIKNMSNAKQVSKSPEE